MEFVLTDEQEALWAMVRTLLRDRSSESEVGRLMATSDGFDPAVWAQMAELGLTGLAVPEQYGGAGCGPIEVGIVMEEAAAALLCAPYRGTAVLAIEALLAAGDDAACKAYLPGLVLAVARTPHGASLFVVDSGVSGDQAQVRGHAAAYRGSALPRPACPVDGGRGSCRRVDRRGGESGHAW